jgi:hypothetical protein
LSKSGRLLPSSDHGRVVSKFFFGSTLPAAHLSTQLGLRFMVQTAQSRLARLNATMHLLQAAFGLLLICLAWWSIDGVRAWCGGSGDPLSGLPIGLVTVILAVCARSCVPGMAELRALPGGAVILLLAGFGWATIVSAPVLVLVLAGCGWAWAAGAGLEAVLRGAALLGGIISITWAIMAGRSWPGWSILGLGIASFAASAAPSLTVTACVLASLVIALPGLAMRIPPSVSSLTGRIGRGWAGILLHILSERPLEVPLRLLIAAGLAASGGWWLAGWQPSVLPSGMVLVAGLAGLAVNGLVHLTTDFRATRSELLTALPVSDLRWRVLAYAVPLTVQGLTVGILTILAVGLGSPPLGIGLAVGIALAVALSSLRLLEAYPDNGGMVAALFPVIAARLAGVICS